MVEGKHSLAVHIIPNHTFQLILAFLFLVPPRYFLPSGWITAIFSLGRIVGLLPSGFLTDFVGRKRCIIFLSFVFTVDAVIQLVPSATRCSWPAI